MRDTRTAYQARADATERSIDAALAEAKAAKASAEAEASEAYAKRTAAVPFTAEELKAARAIRTFTGWHKVSSVNAKTVSVETGYSWTDHYAIHNILEVRA